MWEFAGRYFQKVEVALSGLQLEIYQENKSISEVQKEMDEILSVTKDWTERTVAYFQRYEVIFTKIPLEKAVERIREKYGSIKKLQKEIKRALTPANLAAGLIGGLGPAGTAAVVLVCTIGFSNPIGIGVMVGTAVLGLFLCGGLYLYNKHTKTQKMQEVEKLQRTLDKFSTQFDQLGTRIGREGFKSLLAILQNIEETTKDFEKTFLSPVKQEESSDSSDSKTVEFQCSICFDDSPQGLVAPNTCSKHSAHYFHKPCLTKWESTRRPLKQCPYC